MKQQKQQEKQQRQEKQKISSIKSLDELICMAKSIKNDLIEQGFHVAMQIDAKKSYADIYLISSKKGNELVADRFRLKYCEESGATYDCKRNLKIKQYYLI